MCTAENILALQMRPEVMGPTLMMAAAAQVDDVQADDFAGHTPHKPKKRFH